MGYFSDLDIERQEQAGSLTMGITAEQDAAASAAIDSLVDLGRKVALTRLRSAGKTISRTTLSLNKKLHAPMRALPLVRSRGEEEVLVGYLSVRQGAVAILSKNLRQAKAAKWPSALTDEQSDAAVSAVRGEYLETGEHGTLLDTLVSDSGRRSELEGVD